MDRSRVEGYDGQELSGQYRTAGSSVDHDSITGTSLALSRLQHSSHYGSSDMARISSAMDHVSEQTTSMHSTGTPGFASIPDEHMYMGGQQYMSSPHEDPYMQGHSPASLSSGIDAPIHDPVSTMSYTSGPRSSQGASMQPYRPPSVLSSASITSSMSHYSSPSQGAMRYESMPHQQQEPYGFVPENVDVESVAHTDISNHSSVRQGQDLSGVQELPAYYHNIITNKMRESQVKDQHDEDTTKQMELNPVTNVVADRSSLISILLPFLSANIGLLLFLYLNSFWNNTTPGFAIEILIIVPVSVKLLTCLFTPQRPHDQVLVDGQNVVVFVSVYNEHINVLTKTLGAIHAQTYKSLALVVVVDHHADGLRNVLELLEADVADGAVNPVTGDLEYNGIYDDELPYTVIMKRHHSGKHGSECVFLRHLYKHCENFKYFVTVDGDTALHPDAVSNLVTEMENKPNEIATFGRMLVANDKKSVWTMTQALLEAFEYAVDKHFHSLNFVNYVTRAPGSFCCFRTDRVFSSQYDYWGLSLDSKNAKSYLWKPQQPFGRNLLLQEDRRRTIMLILNRDPLEQIVYVRSAIAETYVPTDVRGFISKYRRRYASTLANNFQMLGNGKAWKSYLGVASQLHSLVSMLAAPVLTLYAYASIVRAFGNPATAGLLMGLWLLLICSTILFVNGHMRYILHLIVLFVTAPVAFIYIPTYAVFTFTTLSWGTRSENTGVSPSTGMHLGVTVVATVALVLVMSLGFWCEDLDTKCLI